MSKRKFGFEGFGINRQPTFNFETSQQPQRLYVPPSSRFHHDNYEDTDLDNIDYDENNNNNKENQTNTDDDDDDDDGNNNNDRNEGDEIDPLDAFMESIQEEVRSAPPPKPKDKAERYKDDEEDDPMETFLRAKKDLGLTLASEALHAGYNSDEEVYAAAKAIDAGMVEYDSDDNPIVLDKKKIEPILPLDHSEIDYEPFTKDFYEEKESISGKWKAQHSLFLVYEGFFFFFFPDLKGWVVELELNGRDKFEKCNWIWYVLPKTLTLTEFGFMSKLYVLLV